MRVPGRLAQGAVSLALLLVVAVHAAGVYRLGAIERLDAWLYDAWLHLTAPADMDERVAILDIDEASLKAIGRWPWNREVMRTLVDRLFDDYHIASLGFDVVFAEPDTSSGLGVLRELAQTELAGVPGLATRVETLAPKLDYDARFASALRDRAVSLGFYFIPAGFEAGQAGQLPDPALPADAFKPLVLGEEAVGYGANLARFQQAAPIAGFFNMKADADGTARRMHLVARHGGAYHVSLSASTLNAAFGGEPYAAGVERKTGGFEPWIDVAGMRIPLSADGSVYVPYRRGSPFAYISAVKVLRGEVPASQLENRILLVGSTAPGLSDLRVTPFSSTFPGVEIHANLIAGMLDGTTRHTPPWAKAAILAAVLVAGLLLLVTVLRFSPGVGLGAALLLGTGLIGAYAYSWQQNWVVPMAAPLLTVFGLYALNTAWGFFAETRNKRQITRLFGQYVPPELADEMSRDPTHYTMEGQSREMTVLFSDIRGFTDFSEKLSPTELSAVLNAYLSKMTAIVQQHHGTIDKYIGDAIMAFWNAPVDVPDHATRAVAAALDMLAAVPGINQDFAARGWPEVKIGVGINTGRMSVGNMGSEFRMSYTVMGDAVNLGSRLEGITKQYGVALLVTQATVDADPVHRYLKIDDVRVKGKQLPVAIYEPLGRKEALSPEVEADAQAFSEAFAAYQAQEWDRAEAALTALRDRAPRKLYDVYLERIAHFRDAPPPEDWDGVFVFTTK